MLLFDLARPFGLALPFRETCRARPCGLTLSLRDTTYDVQRLCVKNYIPNISKKKKMNSIFLNLIILLITEYYIYKSVYNHSTDL